MVALCKKNGSLGVVTCTTGRAVGNSVPHAKENVGAIATQHLTNIFHGTNGLRLLGLGFHPKNVLKSSLALDSNPEQRQILIVDSIGNTAAHTGEKNSEWCGHIEGLGYAIGGNILSGPKVLEEMEESFKRTESLTLHDRLLCALDAGWEAGGCNAPDHTAAILVVGLEENMKLAYRPILSLHVDYSETATPTKDLRKIYEDYKKWVSEMRSQGTRHTIL
jgi:uncharacterized Ntn-hydrolase superfamily protein